MAFLDSNRVRPDKHKDRAYWNKSWEDDLQLWRTYSIPNIPRAQVPSSVELTSADLDPIRSDILSVQTDTRKMALSRFATDQFAEKWTGLSPSRRKEHVLEALYQTCTMGPDLERYRKWCPDMNVDALGSDPQAYLTLLMALIEGEDNQIKSFPHLVVDGLFGKWARSAKNGTLVVIEKMRLDRTFFISMTLWKTLLSFYGKEEGVRVKISGTTESDRRAAHDIRSSLKSGGTTDKALLRSMKRAVSAKHAEEKGMCWGCGKTKRDLPSNTSFQACSGCKKVNQIILYCSRECQKRDWKSGLAGSTPHREECGKPWKVVVEGESSTSDSTPLAGSISGMALNIIPQVNDKFRRSPALQYQIRQLTQTPGEYPDYVIVMGHPEPDVEITIPDPSIAVGFISARTRAFKSGDAGAVDIMYKTLRFLSMASNTPMPNLRKQLEAEYGVDMDEASRCPWSDATDDEMMEAMDIVMLSPSKRVMDTLTEAALQESMNNNGNSDGSPLFLD
ncbi:hypothetical protein BXZ70DRAFT_369185 [Cristinia sonorae]|uniref:MYND-type domain-containing protein n=1 Tax=Cristinia sonorae TaxID=1940300 RepID=A0A8K0UJL0_9AGAR|nr:hypothetical protein BXZ70DRAFT_369185 [Cristinia sonorae]